MSSAAPGVTATDEALLREVERAVAVGPSDALELVISTARRGAAVRAVCAMLNGAGGLVILGVGEGRVLTGQDVSPETLDGLAAELARIDPPPPVLPAAIPLPNGRALIVLRVPASESIHAYDGVPYVRADASSVPVSSEASRTPA